MNWTMSGEDWAVAVILLVGFAVIYALIRWPERFVGGTKGKKRQPPRPGRPTAGKGERGMREPTVYFYREGGRRDWRWHVMTPDEKVAGKLRCAGRSSEGYRNRGDCAHGAKATLSRILSALAEFRLSGIVFLTLQGDDHYRWTVEAVNGEPLAVQGPVNGYELSGQAQLDVGLTALALLHWWVERRMKATEDASG